MEPFTFYDQLEGLADGLADSDTLEKKYNLIIDMTDEQIEILAAIIIHFAIKSGQSVVASNVDKLYLAKKTGGKGRMIQVKNLPDRLQKIIVAYLNWLSK